MKLFSIEAQHFKFAKLLISVRSKREKVFRITDRARLQSSSMHTVLVLCSLFGL